MNTIYKKGGFSIYKASGGHGYIVHNTRKEFQDGHTHINNFKTAEYIVNLCIHRSIPKGKSKYIFISLARITDNRKYRYRLLTTLEDITKEQILDKDLFTVKPL